MKKRDEHRKRVVTESRRKIGKKQITGPMRILADTQKKVGEKQKSSSE